MMYKQLFFKYKGYLFAAGFALAVIFAFMRKSGPDDPLDNTAGRKNINEFQRAEALSGHRNDLTEHEFADSKAQAAFSGEAAKASESSPPSEVKPGPVAAPVIPASAVAVEPSSTRDRAAALLGGAETKSSQQDAPKASHSDGQTPSQVAEAPRHVAKTPKSISSHSAAPPGVTLTSAEESSSNRPLKTMPVSVASISRTSDVYAKNPPSVMAKLDAGQVTETMGGRSTYARGNLLKSGSEYLAVIHDAMELTGSQTQDVNIAVYGRLTPFTVTQPFILTGEAKLSANGRKICVTIKSCIDPHANAKAISCSGAVKGLDGTDCLADEIYSPGIWPSLLRIAGTVASTFSLSKLTSSVTQSGVLVDQTESNAMWAALSSGYQATGEQLAQAIEQQGSGVKTYGESVVKVHITKDSVLW